MSATDTQIAARMDTASAMVLRLLCLEVLHDRPCTADEVATHLCRSVLSIRPRISELNRAGAIRDTLRRRPNASGHSAIVWEVAP